MKGKGGRHPAAKRDKPAAEGGRRSAGRSGRLPIAIFITIRMKSSRLPLKVLRLIEGKPVFEHMVERLKMAGKADGIVMCTSTNPQDDILVDHAKRLGIRWFRGSEEDVLERLLGAAEENGVEFIVSTTGDNPFTDPEYIDKLVDFYRKSKHDYIRYQGLPLGANPYGMRVDSLRKVVAMKKERDTEIWGPFFTENPAMKCTFLEAKGIVRKPDVRLTVDTPEDLELVRAIFAELYEPGKVIPLADAMRLLERKPALLDINSKVVQIAAKKGVYAAPAGHIRIGERLVGPTEPVFLIAEAGVNHNGSLALAKKLADAAAEAGADAVKFQTFKSSRLVTKSADRAAYQKKSGEGSQFDMLRKLELSDADHRALLAHCRKKRIAFMSTPFDEESADLLDSLGVPAFKVGSGDLTNTPLLEHIAAKGKPMLISTGMATLSEIGIAMDAVRSTGNSSVLLLHCTSAYPAPKGELNLRAIQTLASRFNVPVGYSDHTVGLDASLLAVGAGACLLEKHFTLDRTMEGPDHKASIEPEELARLVNKMRHARSMLGSSEKRPSASERDVMLAARKSVVAARRIAKGRVVTKADLAFKRPGTGIPPYMASRIIGRKAKRDIPADTVIEEGWVDG